MLAVIVSSWFFEGVVRRSTADAAAYRRVEVDVKETTTTGWICLPDHLDPAGRAILEHLPAVAAVPGGQPAVALRTLPRDTAAFTGRTSELDRLAVAVCETAASGVIGIHAVDGMAGIGKTAFAVHAAHQLADRFPDGQIFLPLHAHTAGQRPVDPAGALATLLLTTGVAPQQIPPGLEARSATWRATWPARRCCWCWMMRGPRPDSRRIADNVRYQPSRDQSCAAQRRGTGRQRWLCPGLLNTPWRHQRGPVAWRLAVGRDRVDDCTRGR